MITLKSSETKLFFSSDQHFYHDNIIKYCSRPFADSYEMNLALIENWNKVVPEDGLVIVAGDFAYGRCTHTQIVEAREALNGEIILVAGNHDKDVIQAHFSKKRIFKDIYYDLDLRIITDEEHKGSYIDINVNHFPKIVWNKKHHGAWQAFGHCHSKGRIDGQDKTQYDVGVDANNFTPISLNQLGTKITQRIIEGWEM